jgi:hypothetical protein
MRRFPVTTFIIILAVIAAVSGWKLFAHTEHQRFVAVQRVLNSRSEVRLTYVIEHGTGPIAREIYAMQNIDGVSKASYTAFDRKGTKATFDEPIVGYGVTFLFQKLVQDGIWDLHTRQGRGPSTNIYAVTISQVADKSSGSHHFEFTDPHYLATTAGREYHIHLDPHKPVPDLLTLDSTATADPRYQQIVDDFDQFGPASFKRTVIAAREKLLRS